METHILVVDDEKEIADLLELYLQSENYIVHKFYSSSEAVKCIQNHKLDLAILDIMLPGINGFELCKMIREKDNYPVIMLTAKSAELDKITGLTIGADDYVTKPFLPLEVMARVKAQLRRYKRYGADERSGQMEEEEELLVCKDLTLNSKAHKCILSGKEIELTPTEFAIVEVLCQRKGKVVNAEELFHALWADEYYSKSNNTISVHIRHIREKLGDISDKPQYIKTVWGVGYKIDG